MINLLTIYGCGGHARSVADVALDNGLINLTFLDENARPNEELFGFPVVADQHKVEALIIALGDNVKRAVCFELYRQQNIDFTNLISNKAYVSQFAKLGMGIFVGVGAHIGPKASIGNNTIINTHAIIEHDCQIGEHTHIAIGARIAGSAKIGDFVMVGAGATIRDGISVCDNVIIGANAVVIKSIDVPGTYVGVPAKKINLKGEPQS